MASLLDHPVLKPFYLLFFLFPLYLLPALDSALPAPAGPGRSSVIPGVLSPLVACSKNGWQHRASYASPIQNRTGLLRILFWGKMVERSSFFLSCWFCWDLVQHLFIVVFAQEIFEGYNFCFFIQVLYSRHFSKIGIRLLSLLFSTLQTSFAFYFASCRDLLILSETLTK